MSPLTCVVYHNIGRETKFERGLGVTTSPDVFRAQIDWMARHYAIIDLDTLLSGKLPRRPLLITFDDCYASVKEAVETVLSPKGLPSLFFVNSALLGPDSISLDSVLACCAADGGFEQLRRAVGSTAASVGELIANDMSKLNATERLVLKAKLRENFQIASFDGRSPLITGDDLPGLARHGCEIGNHTATHVHCRSLTRTEIETEISGSKSMLESLTGQQVRAFAMPYGHARDLTPDVLAKLRQTEHLATFLVQARSNRFRPAADVWHRVSLRNEAPASLEVRLRWLPLLRSAKQMVRGQG